MDSYENLENVELYGIANVQQYKTEVGFRTLVEGVQENLYVVPDFQRVFRWNENQVENLAVSLIRGMPIPPIYTFRNELGQLEILDGQQRILSMFFYYIGKFTKKERKNHIKLQQFRDNEENFQDALEKAYDLKIKKYKMKYIDSENGNETQKEVDITYKNLPKEIKRKLDYTSITVIEINIDNRDLKRKYLYKIFANLNSGGKQLNQQELRNGIYQSDFYSMLYEFNTNNTKWKNIYRIKEEDKFSKDIELLLRFCAFSDITKFSKNQAFIVDDFRNLRLLLNNFSEKAMNFESNEIDRYKKKLEKFVNQIDPDVPKKVTLLDVLFIIIDKTDIGIEISKNMCDSIINNDEYSKLVQDGTANKSGLEKRTKVVYNELQKYDK